MSSPRVVAVALATVSTIASVAVATAATIAAAVTAAVASRRAAVADAGTATVAVAFAAVNAIQRATVAAAVLLTRRAVHLYPHRGSRRELLLAAAVAAVAASVPRCGIAGVCCCRAEDDLVGSDVRDVPVEPAALQSSHLVA